jgi:glycosyltransferase involved in cell wall biosynthesis
MKISVGILAWNEEASIRATMASLLRQQFFSAMPEGLSVEVICVPNGCTDRTEEVATRAFCELRPANLSEEQLSLQVHAVEMPSKINAWNRFVHDFSDQEADLIFLMDSDIKLIHADTIGSMMRTFDAFPEVIAVTDRPVKHVELKEKKGLGDRISLALNRTNQAAAGQMTGQMYAVRGAFVRQIIMPLGLIIDDGFLKYMICTGFYRHELNTDLIKRAPDAAHVYEGYSRLKDVVNHQRRQAVGSYILNRLLTYLRTHSSATCDASQLLKMRNDEDPNWLIRMLQLEVEQGGRWLFPRHILFSRLLRLKNLPLKTALLRFPIALSVFCFDLFIFSLANRALKQGTYLNVWKDTSSLLICE